MVEKKDLNRQPLLIPNELMMHKFTIIQQL